MLKNYLNVITALMVARGGAWGWKKWVKGVLNIFKIIIKIKVCSQLKNKTNKTTNKNKQKKEHQLSHLNNFLTFIMEKFKHIESNQNSTMNPHVKLQREKN